MFDMIPNMLPYWLTKLKIFYFQICLNRAKKSKKPKKSKKSQMKMLFNRTNSYIFAGCTTLANIIEIFQNMFHMHLHFT